MAMTFDLLDQIESSLAISNIGIEEFAESDSFCDKPLYPRQKVLLKLIFLEELTGEEEDILDYWIAGGRGGDEIQISPNIRDRVEYLRAHGYKHFREIDLVAGRRASKGFVTGMALAKVMWDTLQLQDPGRYYGIDPDKDIYFSCVAGSESQAKEFQYADFNSAVMSCKAFEPYVANDLETIFSISTPEDLRKLQQRRARGVKSEKAIARLRGKALAANAGTLRGSATMALVIDEMAHMIAGESKASADQVYNAATPALDQFGRDGIIFCNPPEAPIWMADLSHKPIGEIKVGDKVVGWNKDLERSPTGHKERVLQESTVLNVIRRQSPIVKVTMESGRVFRCTPDHRWLTLSSGGARKGGEEWYAEPKVGRRLAHVIDPTPPLDDDLIRDAAWLGGIFDGEGYAAKGKALTIRQSKSVNPNICARIEQVLDRLGFDWTYHQINSKLGQGGAYHIRAYEDNSLRKKQAWVDFANWTQPVQLHKIQEKVLTSKWRSEDRIVSIEPDGYGEVVAMTTSTGNYVCNGYASKNCNSSPYSKVGMFYDRYVEAMRPYDKRFTPGEQLDPRDDSKINGSPLNMTIQVPSWALFEGYKRYRSRFKPGHKFEEVITASPDWDPEAKDDDGTDLYSERDKQKMIVQKAKEAANPETFKVENRGKFAEVTDAYLNPTMVDRMFMGVPAGFDGSGRQLLEPISTNYGEGVRNIYKYKFHLDPSSTTAGFGFAIAHTEEFPDKEGNPVAHVVFDLIKRWNPRDFPGDTIAWPVVINEIIAYADLFRPFEITFDQFQSAEPIQTLKYALMERGIEGTHVGVKTATLESNWFRAETFKTALNHALVHAPGDVTAIDPYGPDQELKFLQQTNTGGRYPRVDKQTIGPVQTKDMADCVMECVETLIGNQLQTMMRHRAVEAVMAPGAQGGFRIGGLGQSNLGNTSMHPALAAFYDGLGQRVGEQTMPTIPSRMAMGNGRRGMNRLNPRSRGRW